jgi:hypothetical protein
LEHKNFLNLKNEVEQVADLILTSMPENTASVNSATFHSAIQAIEQFTANEHLTEQEKTLLVQMEQTGNRHISAAWETYTIINDPEDFLDTLKVIIQVHEEYEQNLRQRSPQAAAVDHLNKKSSFAPLPDGERRSSASHSLTSSQIHSEKQEVRQHQD